MKGRQPWWFLLRIRLRKRETAEPVLYETHWKPAEQRSLTERATCKSADVRLRTGSASQRREEDGEGEEISAPPQERVTWAKARVKACSAVHKKATCLTVQRLSVSAPRRIWTFAAPGTAARRAPLPMQFSRQEHWSGLSIPSSGALPDLGIKLSSPTRAGRFFTPWIAWEDYPSIFILKIFHTTYQINSTWIQELNLH